MIYDCIKCGTRGELRRGKRPGNNQTAYLAMEDQIRNSFLKSCPRLCPDCLSKLVAWMKAPAHPQRFDHRVRHRMRRRRVR